jgi:hypothetical protein
VYAHLRPLDLAPEYGAMLVNRALNDYYNTSYLPIPITVTDANGSGYNYDFQLTLGPAVGACSSSSLIYESDKAQLDIELIGPGSSDGISKDIWIHLSFSGQATYGVDLTSELEALPNGAETYGTNDKQWVKFPERQTKVSILLPIKFDDYTEGDEVLDIIADEYVIHRVSETTGQNRFYVPSGPSPVNGSNDQTSLTIQDQEKIIGDYIHNEEWANGLHEYCAPFAPGDLVNGTLSTYGDPARMVVRDGSERDGEGILLDTGRVDGHNIPINFTVPITSEGSVLITMDPVPLGTIWEFQLTRDTTNTPEDTQETEIHGRSPQAVQSDSVNMPSSKAVMSVGTVNGISTKSETIYTDVSSSDTMWSIITNTTSVLVEGNISDTATGTSFTIEREGDTSQAVSVGWRVTPTGDYPISSSDFDSGNLPSGILTLIPGYKSSRPIYFEHIDTTDTEPIDDHFGLTKDDIQEPVETFNIELFEPDSGAIITPTVATENMFSVRDIFGFITTTYGTDDAEVLDGNDEGNDIRAKSGDDTIHGFGENDYLYGGNGNDVIDAGGGDDSIEGGFGDDQITGGDGFDTVHIARTRAMVDIQLQSDSSYIIDDLSDVPLGTDILSGVERLSLADGVLELGYRMYLPSISTQNVDTTISGYDLIAAPGLAILVTAHIMSKKVRSCLTRSKTVTRRMQQGDLADTWATRTGQSRPR